MPAHGTSTALGSLQGRKAAAERWNRPEKDDLAREYATEKLADYIRRTVEAAPPLTDDQRARLASLLRPTALTSGGLDGVA